MGLLVAVINDYVTTDNAISMEAVSEHLDYIHSILLTKIYTLLH